MWHAKTLKQRLRAWAKNKTFSFVLAVISVLLGIPALASFVYDNFIKSSPAVVQPLNAGSATTSGPQSPAITGNGNSVTYGEPDTNKKKNAAKKPKE
jgi:hypothetical protein